MGVELKHFVECVSYWVNGGPKHYLREKVSARRNYARLHGVTDEARGPTRALGERELALDKRIKLSQEMVFRGSLQGVAQFVRTLRADWEAQAVVLGNTKTANVLFPSERGGRDREVLTLGAPITHHAVYQPMK
jgi:hypothetical protein